jgi:hypothetical protein
MVCGVDLMVCGIIVDIILTVGVTAFACISENQRSSPQGVAFFLYGTSAFTSKTYKRRHMPFKFYLYSTVKLILLWQAQSFRAPRFYKSTDRVPRILLFSRPYYCVSTGTCILPCCSMQKSATFPARYALSKWPG